MSRINDDKKSGSAAPSESFGETKNPKGANTESTQPQEGDIRKVVRTTDRQSFDDDYEVKKEDDMVQDEADSENENDVNGRA